MKLNYLLWIIVLQLFGWSMVLLGTQISYPAAFLLGALFVIANLFSLYYLYKFIDILSASAVRKYIIFNELQSDPDVVLILKKRNAKLEEIKRYLFVAAREGGPEVGVFGQYEIDGQFTAFIFYLPDENDGKRVIVIFDRNTKKYSKYS